MRHQFAIAVKCIVESKKGILLLEKSAEEARQDTGTSRYDLPGGRVEYGEDIVTTINREIKEETGLYIINEPILKGVKTVIREDGIHLVVLHYYCMVNDNVVQLSSEHIAYTWMSKSEILMDSTIPSWIKEVILK